MKVIFLQDVPGVAKAGETKQIANGYGRNYLIPRRIALVAKPGATHDLEVKLKIEARERSETEAKLAEIAKQLDGMDLNIEAKAGAKARLYGSITAADIASEIKRTTKLLVDKKKIDLAKPIHQLGIYEVSIKLAKDLTPKIKVTVEEKKKE